MNHGNKPSSHRPVHGELFEDLGTLITRKFAITINNCKGGRGEEHCNSFVCGMFIKCWCLDLQAYGNVFFHPPGITSFSCSLPPMFTLTDIRPSEGVDGHSGFGNWHVSGTRQSTFPRSFTKRSTWTQRRHTLVVFIHTASWQQGSSSTLRQKGPISVNCFQG